LAILKTISIVAPCFNEVCNIHEFYSRVVGAISGLPYNFEIIIIDNSSTDGTVECLRDISSKDPRVKVILNAANYGQVRSPFYGILQSSGDACIQITSDLQDPPELIPALIREWELGFRSVLLVYSRKESMGLLGIFRNIYYKILTSISEAPVIPNATGVGLYDGTVVSLFRKLRDPIPYQRGLLTEFGHPLQTIEFDRPNRSGGLSKNNIIKLYDLAMLGLVSHAKAPLRALTFIGLVIGILSIFVALGFFIAKLLFWGSFQVGIAPILIGMFFLSGLQFFFFGIMGEYILAIHLRLQRKNYPLVIERERINF